MISNVYLSNPQKKHWLSQEGITLPHSPDSNFNAVTVEGAICGAIANGESGSFYISPRDYLSRNRDTVVKSLGPEAVGELDIMISQSSGKEVIR